MADSPARVTPASVMPFAHIAGVPAEELLPAAYGAAGVLVALRVLARHRLLRRGRRRPQGR
ncbi:MAG TPA: hypothetical protein VF752_12000 [Thermoleophilaceae bacterium]